MAESRGLFTLTPFIRVDTILYLIYTCGSFLTIVIMFLLLLTGCTSGAVATAEDQRISVLEAKELLRQLLQIAALRKQVQEAEAQSSSCPLWMQERNACSPFPPFSGFGTRTQNPGIAASLEVSSDDNMSLNKEFDAATGTGQEPDSSPRDQSAQQSDLMTRKQRGEGPHPGHQIPTQSDRASRVLSRFMGKTMLNRPIRVDFSRGPKSGKRALDCIRKCIVEGGLHPVQCHSIC